MEPGTLGSDRDHNPCQLSSLPKNKRMQLPPLASYSYTPLHVHLGLSNECKFKTIYFT